jgi:hypothetical protein
MKAGAAEFLTKPFRDEDLLAAIDQAFESARHAAERARIPSYSCKVVAPASIVPRSRPCGTPYDIHASRSIHPLRPVRAFVQRGGTLASFERLCWRCSSTRGRSNDWRTYTFV